MSSYAIDDGERLLLFDPLALPDQVEQLAAEREDGGRADVPVARMRRAKPRVSARRAVLCAAAGRGDPNPAEGQVFTAGERLLVGEAYPGMEPNDLVLWLESRRALLTGDTLIDRGSGLEFPVAWADKGVPADQLLEPLRPLLELPVELVLPTHGPPTDRAAQERALS